MNKKFILIAGMMCVFLMTSCTQTSEKCKSPTVFIGDKCCVDSDSDQICDDTKITPEEKSVESLPESENTSIINEEKPETEIGGLLPERKFGMEQLSAELSRIMNKSIILKEDNIRTDQFIKDMHQKSHTFLTNNNEFRDWVIEYIQNPDEQIESIQEFYDYIEADKWTGWNYYVNETTWKWLYPPITEQELKEIDQNYNFNTNYRGEIYSAWVDIDVKEKGFQTESLPIAEYQLITMILSSPPQEKRYWLGNWEPFLIVYKIPCTKDIIIYHRPDYKYVIEASFWNYKKDEITNTWQREIDGMKSKSVPRIKEILKFCGVKEDAVNYGEFKESSSTTQKVHNWKVYYARVFNYSLEAEANVLPADPDNETFKIKMVNISMTSFLDEEYFLSLRVKIELETDGKKRYYYDASLSPQGKFLYGEKKSVELSVRQNERIRKNTSMIIRPYYGETDGGFYQYFIGKPKILKLT